MHDRMNAKLGQYCGLVHGNILESTPDGPIEGGTNGLLDSVALFRGIQRPMIGAGLDRDVYVYVTTPPVSYEYPQEERFADKGPTRVRRPADSVFVTYAEIGDRASGKLKEWAAAGFKCDEAVGIIHDWEWVLRSPSEQTLPDRHGTRYAGRMW